MRFHFPWAGLHSFALLAVFALAGGQVWADCNGYRGLEQSYLDYDALLDPRSDEHARSVAARVQLDIGHAEASSYMQQKGLRPTQSGAETIAEGIEGLRELSAKWLAGEAIGRSTSRQHKRTRNKMGRALISSGCFEPGAEGSEKDYSDAPEEEESTNPRSLRSLSSVSGFGDFSQNPPPIWMLVLIFGTPVAVVAIWFAYRHHQRVRETRGYPRDIFTGTLTFRSGQRLVKVQAADLGRGGTKVKRDDDLVGDQNLALVVGDKEVPALLGWENRHYMGISFHDPISRTLLRTLRKGQQHA